MIEKNLRKSLNNIKSIVKVDNGVKSSNSPSLSTDIENMLNGEAKRIAIVVVKRNDNCNNT